MNENNTDATAASEAPETTETTTDTAEAPEGTVEATEAPESNLTMESLLNLTGDDYVELADGANHRGIKPLHEWMKHVPEDVRKHLGNLRTDYSRKTQAVSDARRELDEERAAFEQYKSNIVNGKLAQEVSNIDTETEYD